MRGEISGWTRIGRYDSEDERGYVQAIDLCSGREGDDAYVRLDATNPQWEDLCDVLLRVEGDCGISMPPVSPGRKPAP